MSVTMDIFETLEQLKKEIQAKESKIKELEVALKKNAQIVHNHYHYDQPCSRPHYYYPPSWTNQYQPLVVNCGAGSNQSSISLQGV